MAVNDVFQSTIEYAVWGQSFTLTNYWREEASGSGTGNARDLAEGIVATLIPDLLPLVGDDAIVGCVACRQIAPTLANPWVERVNDGEGTAGDNTGPPNVTVVLNQANATPGGQSNGSNQLSGMVRSSMTNGVMNNGWLTGVGATYAAHLVNVLTSPGANDYQPGGWSTVLNNAPRVPPVFGANFDANWNPATRCRQTRNTPLTGSVNLGMP